MEREEGRGVVRGRDGTRIYLRSCIRDRVGDDCGGDEGCEE
jgi:hypothetical protein